MSSDLSTIEESIKIALDAADAATDVTSEYNKVKREHKKAGDTSEANISLYHHYFWKLNDCRRRGNDIFICIVLSFDV